MGKLTYCSNWLRMQREGKKKRGAPMASVESQLGENALARYREGGSGNRGGYGVFQLTAELGVVVDEAKAHRPAPFIGG
jgi:hypothetical protein